MLILHFSTYDSCKENIILTRCENFFRQNIVELTDKQSGIHGFPE